MNRRTLPLALLAAATLAAGCTTTPSSPKAAKPDQPSAASSDGGSASTAPAVAAGQVLLQLSGSGAKTTQKFTTGSDWDLSYSYFGCPGGQGNFIVDISSPGGDFNSNTGINELGSGKTDVTHYHEGGTFFLDINSECSWKVKVTTA